MKKFRGNKNAQKVRSLAAAVLILAGIDLSGILAARAADKTPEGMTVKKVAGGNQQENFERDVDQVALESQTSSIVKLQNLLKKYVGKRQEPSLISKLAELQVQKASIRFRIAHGAAHRSKKAINLDSYHRDMNDAIKSLNDLITRYPGFEEIAQSYYLRGKAYEEIGNKTLAIKDYLYLVKTFPDYEQTTSAYMALADFAIEANEHPKAITYLREVEKHAEDPKYPFAIYKLAWSHYNLKQIPQALSYVEKHVGYYNRRRAADPRGVLPPADDSFRENMLLDSMVFFFEGYEQKDEHYSVAGSLEAFRKYESGPVLGKMLARYTKLLRSHGYEQDLIRFKDMIMKEESKRPETLDVLVTVFDFQVGKRRYTQAQDTASDLIALHKQSPALEGWPKAEKLILDTADDLQKTIVKNKNADGVSQLSAVLVSIYDSFTKLVPDTDPRIPRVHYNLAETLFEIHDYELATLHYRWIVSHGKFESKNLGAASVADAGLKAVGARYELLRSRGLIPQQISAKPISATQMKAIDPTLQEWVGWVDQQLKWTPEPAENFAFEAARALYAQEQILPATERLHAFAKTYPASKFAIPAASLVLDTAIASQDWEKLGALAEEFMKVKAWKDAEFAKRLFTVAADSSYKIMEKSYVAKDFPTTLQKVETFLKHYAASDRFADTLFLAGSAALESKNADLADKYFARLIAEAPKSGSVRAALLNRAKIAEDRLHFADAARTFKQYLRMPAVDGEAKTANAGAIREKALTYAWLSGDQGELRDSLSQKTLCSNAEDALCDKYRALLEIASHGVDEDATHANYDRARRGVEANRGLWAIAALGNSKVLSFYHRMNLIRQVASAWDELDPLLKFALIPEISNSIPRAMQMTRAGVAIESPLRANPKWITHRVDVIKEVEVTVTKLMKTPWSRIRAQMVSELGGVYLDFAKGITSLPLPKDLSEADRAAYDETIRKLVLPFEEKGQDMRAKAFEIASRFAIEDESYASISEPYFLDNPSVSKRLKPAIAPTAPQPIDLVFLSKLDPNGDWNHLKTESDSQDPVLQMKSQWADALAKKNWARVGYLQFQAQNRNLFSKTVSQLTRAISLAAVGARGEALTELEEARKDLPAVDSKKFATFALLQYYFASLSRERTKQFLGEIFSMDPETDVALHGKPEIPAAEGAVAGAKSPGPAPASVKKDAAAKAAVPPVKKEFSSRDPWLKLLHSAEDWIGG